VIIKSKNCNKELLLKKTKPLNLYPFLLSNFVKIIVMKKVVFTLLIALMAPGFVVSQQRRPVADKPAAETKRKSPEERAQISVDELDKIVSLSSDQKTKVYNLALNRAKSVDEVIMKYKGQPDKREQAKQEIQQIRKNYRQEVKKILTPEQIEKLKQHHKAKKGSKTAEAEEMIPASDDKE